MNAAQTTAIQFREDYNDPEAEIAAHEVASAWRDRTPVAEDGLYAFAQTIQRVDQAHGELFHYASVNIDVLGWLIERASGRRFRRLHERCTVIEIRCRERRPDHREGPLPPNTRMIHRASACVPEMGWTMSG